MTDVTNVNDELYPIAVLIDELKVSRIISCASIVRDTRITGVMILQSSRRHSDVPHFPFCWSSILFPLHSTLFHIPFAICFPLSLIFY